MKFRRFKLYFIELPLILFVLLLTIISVSYLPTPPDSPTQPIFLDYFTSFTPYLSIPLALLLFITILFVTANIQFTPHQSKHHLTKRTIKYFFGLLLILGVSLPLSFFSTYLYAFAHINYNILSYNFGKTEKDFLTRPQDIADELAITDDLTITTFNPSTYKKELMLLSMKKKNGFYEERVLPSFPNLLYKRSYIPQTTIAYVNNHLAFSSFNPDQLATISPALGKFLIEYSTQRSIIKSMPLISILDKDSYVASRIDSMDNQISQIDDAIESVDDNIATISGYITINEQSIASNQEIKQKALVQKAAVKCKTPEKCESQKAKWDRMMKQADDNIAKAQAALTQNQSVLGTTTQNKENLKNAIVTLNVAEARTDKELGLFTPENKIVMSIDDAKDPDMFDIYMATLIHEYFHYLSYAGDETKLDSFFEEGLTEYFARMAFENYTGRKIDIGYQVGTRIITAMTKKIPEAELLDIYYTKDQKRLEAVLNKTYGAHFYEDNITAFNMLNFLSFEDSIEVANLIMKQIGGEELKITEAKHNNNFSIPTQNETIPNNGQSTADIKLP